nr:MAG TPA: intron associated endonuclease [Caudoviricetes sp.]
MKRSMLEKQHTQLQKDFKSIVRILKKERCERRPLYNAMNKYGIENFVVEELIECPNDELDSYEKMYIEKLQTYGHNGYNATKGGDGSILFDYDKIIETYALGGTMTECAAKMHCSVDTVKKVLTINNIPIRHNRRGCYSDPKKVEQYSLEGVFIKEWESITLAAHWLVDNGYAKTYNSGVKQKIRLCMRGENKTAYKFIWKNPCERTI